MKTLLLVRSLAFITLACLIAGTAGAQPGDSLSNQEAIDMTGKTVLVTGSTDGLGREAALRLGAMGAHVLVHGRNDERRSEERRVGRESGSWGAPGHAERRDGRRCGSGG